LTLFFFALKNSFLTSKTLTTFILNKLETVNTNDFGKQYHILKTAEFKLVYDNKVWSSNREFSFNCMPNDLGYPRIGLVVSKKVSKRAVDRNEIKRKIREWFRHNKAFIGSVDLVVNAKPVTKSLNSSLIDKSLKDLWQKVSKRL